MKLAISICASKKYQFALASQAIAIQQNVFNCSEITEGHIILVTCEALVDKQLRQYRELLGEKWKIHHIPLPIKDKAKSYDNAAQNIIATMMTAGFAKARVLGVDYLWTLDSDVLPDPNNLRCMRDMLKFDSGYYDVAFCPYVTAGRAAYMGGRGDHKNWIYPTIYEDERALSEDLVSRLAAHRATRETEEAAKWHEGMKALQEEIDRSPPKGNIFARQAAGWKKRGWLGDMAPDIGRGAALESDWMPTGNNLFSRKALAFSDFTSYIPGQGTQDLLLSYFRIKPNGINLCVIPHCVSHHVLRRKDRKEGESEFESCYMYHEQDEPYKGHLRHRIIPWYPFVL